ncbi:MAG TPA: tyrosine-type recombinase/integrase [Candidatus Limnocylindrales bacterium]
MVPVLITPAVSGDYRAGVLSWERALISANKSPLTLRVYMTTVKALAAFLVDKGMPTRPDLITGEHVREYLSGIPTPSTRRLRFQTLRTFFGYLVREGEITKSPMLNVEQPKVPDDEAGRSFVSPEALDKMLATCRRSRPPSFIDRRDLALLLLLRHSGLRRSEAAALLVVDVLPDDGTLIVRKGKGAKDRLSAFNRDTSATLLHYIERRRDVVRGKPDHGALFVSENGRGLTGDAVGAVVTRRARLAGVGSVSAHELRHLFADQLKRAGASDETLMSLGGWADAKIVGRYGRSLRRERALEEYRRLTDK